MKPKLAPGLYQLRTGRTFSHKELKIVKHGGVWCVVPRGVKERKV